MDFVSSTLIVGAAIAATMTIVVASSTASSIAIFRLLEPFAILIIEDADKRIENPLSQEKQCHIQVQRSMIQIMPMLFVFMPVFAAMLVSMVDNGDNKARFWDINLVVVRAWIQTVVVFVMLRLILATIQGLFV